VLADSRLGQEKGFRGPGETLEARHRVKYPQEVQIQHIHD